MEMNGTVSLEAKKVELIVQIAQILDYNLLLQVEMILQLNQDELGWENLTQNEKFKLEKGIDSIKKGKVVLNKVAKQRINEYISKL